MQHMVQPVPWVEQFAMRHGARYEPEADDRWLNSWEPYLTLRVAERYDHSLSLTDAQGSRTVARCIVQTPTGEAATWIVVAQDDRLLGHAATSSDHRSPFVEPSVAMPRQRTGNPAFDGAFLTYAPSSEECALALGASVQKLLLSWQLAVHVEIRPGGLVLAPVGLPADPRSLEWLWTASLVLGEKAEKSRRDAAPR